MLSAILDLLYGAKNPVILADACATRHDVVKELHQLVDKLQIPAFVSPMGKGAINETNPHYGGVYVGELSHQDVRSTVESSDLVLSIGALLSDFNTVCFVRIFTSHPRVLSVTTSESQRLLSSTPP